MDFLWICPFCQGHFPIEMRLVGWSMISLAAQSSGWRAMSAPVYSWLDWLYAPAIWHQFTASSFDRDRLGWFSPWVDFAFGHRVVGPIDSPVDRSMFFPWYSWTGTSSSLRRGAIAALFTSLAASAGDRSCDHASAILGIVSIPYSSLSPNEACRTWREGAAACRMIDPWWTWRRFRSLIRFRPPSSSESRTPWRGCSRCFRRGSCWLILSTWSRRWWIARPCFRDPFDSSSHPSSSLRFELASLPWPLVIWFRFCASVRCWLAPGAVPGPRLVFTSALWFLSSVAWGTRRCRWGGHEGRLLVTLRIACPSFSRCWTGSPWDGRCPCLLSYPSLMLIK